MGFNGVVEIDKAIKFNVSVQRVFKLNALVPHLHNSTNDALCLSIGLRSSNPREALTDVVLRASLNKRVIGRTFICSSHDLT